MTSQIRYTGSTARGEIITQVMLDPFVATKSHSDIVLTLLKDSGRGDTRRIDRVTAYQVCTGPVVAVSLRQNLASLRRFLPGNPGTAIREAPDAEFGAHKATS